MVTVSPVVMESSSGRVGMNVQRMMAVGFLGAPAELRVGVIGPPGVVGDGMAMGVGYGLLYDAESGVRVGITGELGCPWNVYCGASGSAADFSDAPSYLGKRSRSQFLFFFLAMIALLLRKKKRAVRASKMAMTIPAIAPPESPPLLLEPLPFTLTDVAEDPGAEDVREDVEDDPENLVADDTADGWLPMLDEVVLAEVVAETCLTAGGEGGGSDAAAGGVVVLGGAGAAAGGAAGGGGGPGGGGGGGGGGATGAGAGGIGPTWACRLTSCRLSWLARATGGLKCAAIILKKIGGIKCRWSKERGGYAILES
jgi:hypothetical protein